MNDSSQLSSRSLRAQRRTARLSEAQNSSLGDDSSSSSQHHPRPAHQQHEREQADGSMSGSVSMSFASSHDGGEDLSLAAHSHSLSSESISSASSVRSSANSSSSAIAALSSLSTGPSAPSHRQSHSHHYSNASNHAPIAGRHLSPSAVLGLGLTAPQLTRTNTSTTDDRMAAAVGGAGFTLRDRSFSLSSQTQQAQAQSAPLSASSSASGTGTTPSEGTDYAGSSVPVSRSASNVSLEARAPADSARRSASPRLRRNAAPTTPQPAQPAGQGDRTPHAAPRALPGPSSRAATYNDSAAEEQEADRLRRGLYQETRTYRPASAYAGPPLSEPDYAYMRAGASAHELESARTHTPQRRRDSLELDRARLSQRRGGSVGGEAGEAEGQGSGALGAPFMVRADTGTTNATRSSAASASTGGELQSTEDGHGEEEYGEHSGSMNSEVEAEAHTSLASAPIASSGHDTPRRHRMRRAGEDVFPLEEDDVEDDRENLPHGRQVQQDEVMEHAEGSEQDLMEGDEELQDEEEEEEYEDEEEEEEENGSMTQQQSISHSHAGNTTGGGGGGIGADEYSIYLPTEPEKIAEICRFDLGLEGALPGWAHEVDYGARRVLDLMQRQKKKRKLEGAGGVQNLPPLPRLCRLHDAGDGGTVYDAPLPPPVSLREQLRGARFDAILDPEGSKHRALEAERRIVRARGDAKRLHLPKNRRAVPTHPEFDLLAAPAGEGSAPARGHARIGGLASSAALPSSDSGGASAGSGSGSTTGERYRTIWSPFANDERSLPRGRAGRVAQVKLWQAAVSIGDLVSGGSNNSRSEASSLFGEGAGENGGKAAGAVGAAVAGGMEALRGLCGEAQGMDWVHRR